MSLHQFQNFNANDCTSAPFITLARINLKITRTSLSSITIPRTITAVGEHSFAGCTGLDSVEISDLEC
jgi:hypothetical protein